MEPADAPVESRRPMAAGHAVVVVLVALSLGALLNAQGLREGARIRDAGWERDVAMALTRPLAAVSGWLRLDRPRAALEDAIGRGDDPGLRGGTAFAEDEPPPLPPPAGEEPRNRPVFTSRNRLRLWIAGDSLVVTPGESILRAAEATGAVHGVAPVDGRIATGLGRPDVFDWYRRIRRQLERHEPDAVVLAFGANDDHEVMTGVPGAASLGSFGSEAWIREYRRRVTAVMDLVTRRARLLLWLGLPVTSDRAQTTRFEIINAIVHDEARRRGGRVAFVDTYALLTGPDGGYAEYVTDESGALVRIRADDGVHLARAGADLVAEAVMRELAEAFELRG